MLLQLRQPLQALYLQHNPTSHQKQLPYTSNSTIKHINIATQCLKFPTTFVALSCKMMFEHPAVFLNLYKDLLTSLQSEKMYILIATYACICLLSKPHPCKAYMNENKEQRRPSKSIPRINHQLRNLLNLRNCVNETQALA